MVNLYDTPVLVDVGGDGGNVSIEPLMSGNIVLDDSFSETGSLTGPDYVISDDLGVTVGGNLFHSFLEFSLFFGETATFTGPDSIDNILARVTGGNISTINGTIRSTIAT